MTDELRFEDFKTLALRTESKIDSASINMDAFTTLIELFVKVGTLLDYMKKGIYYKNYSKYDENYAQLVNELNEKFAQFLTANSDKEREDFNGLNYRIIHALLGAMTESSEIAEHLHKYLVDGTVDAAGIGEEFSDSDWYKAIGFDELKLSEVVCRQNVIDKLMVRFPDAYSDELAANRDLESERKELEKNI